LEQRKAEKFSDRPIKTVSQKALKVVTPANPGSGSGTGAGVQKGLFFLDSGFRRNDRRDHFLTFYEAINKADP